MPSSRMRALAWKAGDFERFGGLMNASCHSSIHQYECGHEAIIGLQRIASSSDGVYGSRFSGGGYGGCVIALADASQAADAASTISASYREQFPGLADQAAVYLAHAAGGLRQVGADERG